MQVVPLDHPHHHGHIPAESAGCSHYHKDVQQLKLVLLPDDILEEVVATEDGQQEVANSRDYQSGPRQRELTF